MKNYTLNSLMKAFKQEATTNFFYYKKYKCLCVGLYSFGNSLGFSSRVNYFVLLDNDGSLKGVINTDNEENVPFTKGKLSFDNLKDYQREVHDRPKGVGFSHVVGKIENDVFDKLKKKDYLNANIRKTIKVNNRDDDTRSDKTESVLKLHQKYKKFWKKGSVSDNHGDNYQNIFQIGEYTLVTNIELFFYYKVSVTIFGPNNTKLKLDENNCKLSELDSYVTKFLNNDIDEEMKVRLLFNHEYSWNRNFKFQVEGTGKVKTTITYGGEKEPMGSFNFLIDLKKRKVSCENIGRAKVFIPKKVNYYNSLLKEYL